MHSLFTRNGHLRIKKTFLASGPAAARFPKLTRSGQTAAYPGWRFGSLVPCFQVGICLVINFVFLVFAASFTHTSKGTGTLYEGDCAKVRTLDTWVHFVLNGLATALVGASNYNMQCLVAPSRSEVDRAHSKGVWLDIGVPSLRNLCHISRPRVGLWLILAISSVPLHLLWNSAVFSTTLNNSFVVIGVSNHILQNSHFDCKHASVFNNVFYSEIACEMFTSAQNPDEAATSLTRLEGNECIEQYNSAIQGKWSHLVVVLDHEIANNTSCAIEPVALNATRIFAYDSKSVIWWSWSNLNCYDKPASENIKQWFINDWGLGVPTPNTPSYSEIFVESQPQYHLISHCFAMEGPKFCKLNFSLPILVTVVISNTLKLVAMVCTLRFVQGERLMILGDAVSSFLQVPDENTAGSCLGTRESFRRRKLQLDKALPAPLYPRGVIWRKQMKLQWYQAPSRKRWSFTLAL